VVKIKCMWKVLWVGAMDLFLRKYLFGRRTCGSSGAVSPQHVFKRCGAVFGAAWMEGMAKLFGKTRMEAAAKLSAQPEWKQRRACAAAPGVSCLLQKQELCCDHMDCVKVCGWKVWSVHMEGGLRGVTASPEEDENC